MKSFRAELRDFSTDWVYTSVFYENDEIQEILSEENGEKIPLSTLSQFDRERLDRALILNLQADRSEALDYISDWAALREAL